MDLFDVTAGQGPLYIVHLYALSCALLIAAHLSNRPFFVNMASGCLAGTLFLQMLVIVTALGQGGFPRFGYLHCLTFVLSLMSLALWHFKKFIFLCLVAVPLSTILCMLAALVGREGAVIPSDFSAMFTVIHVGTLFIALVSMTLGACAGIVFLLSERQLKAKTKMTEMERSLPSLDRMDAINRWTVSVGFPFFSIGLLGGLVGARMAWGSILTGDVKELLSLVIWLLFARLFHLRLLIGRRGHGPAVWMISIFMLSVLSLTLVNLFMTTTHRF